jgi:hypothetical protein
VVPLSDCTSTWSSSLSSTALSRSSPSLRLLLRLPDVVLSPATELASSLSRSRRRDELSPLRREPEPEPDRAESASLALPVIAFHIVLFSSLLHPVADYFWMVSRRKRSYRRGGVGGSSRARFVVLVRWLGALAECIKTLIKWVSSRYRCRIRVRKMMGSKWDTKKG